MPKRYTFAALAAAFALFAAPAVADGYPDKPVQRGPAPLKPHAPVPPAEGCQLVEHQVWACPSSGEVEVRRYIDESQTRHYVNRYTTGGICCGGTPPPPPPPVIHKTFVERGLTIDTASFSGGVGNGVDGGYYGGGGGFAYASASSSASAFARASAYMSFSGSFKGGHKGKGGGCNVCGGGKKGGGGGKH